MPGKQAKIVSPLMLTRMLRQASRSGSPGPRPRDDPAVRQGGTARLRDRPPRLVDGARRPRQSRGGRRYPRCDRQEALGPTDTHAPRVATRLEAAAARKRTSRTRYPLGARRELATNQRRQLVRGAVRGSRLRRLLLPFRSANLHHSCRPKHSSNRLQPARRAAARRPPIHRDDRALHRRRHARATAPGRPAVKRASPLP